MDVCVVVMCTGVGIVMIWCDVRVFVVVVVVVVNVVVCDVV